MSDQLVCEHHGGSFVVREERRLKTPPAQIRPVCDSCDKMPPSRTTDESELNNARIKSSFEGPA